MFYPLENALGAFLIIFRSLPDPFRSFIVYSIVATFVLAVLWLVVKS